MRRTELRGGAVGEYKISEVLGPRFQQFVRMLDAAPDKLEQFTFIRLEPTRAFATAPGANEPQPNDLHYDFTDYLVAASAAFRQIENPDFGKVKVAAGYADVIYKAFDQLLTGTTAAPQRVFGFNQLPFISNDKYKYLVDGFHLFPYTTDVYPKRFAATSNGLINAVRYLNNYIALLDTTNLTGSDIMALLRSDYLVFMRYVTDIVNEISGIGTMGPGTALPADTKDAIKGGVLDALTVVADQIVAAYKTSVEPSFRTLPADISTVILTNPAAVQTYLGALGVTAGNVNKLYTSLAGLDNLRDRGAIADTIADAKQLTKYSIDSLNKPQYFEHVKQSVTPDELKGLVAPPAAPAAAPAAAAAPSGALAPPAPKAAPAAGTDVPSLSFLYGPIQAADGKQYLTIVPQAGVAGTELVDRASIGNIKDAIVKITGSGAPSESKVALVSLVEYLIVNDKSLATANPADLAAYMGRSLNGYGILYGRLSQMPSSDQELGTYIGQFRQQLRDALGTQFVLGTYGQYDIDPATSKLIKRAPAAGPAPAGPAPTGLAAVTKNNLADPDIWGFYSQIVVANPTFYSRFFNLVDVPMTREIELTAAAMPSIDRTKYRLNVKKIIGYSRLTQLQRGGQERFGDIILVGLIPYYPTDGTIGRLWVNRTTPRGPFTDRNVIKNIVRIVYGTAPVTPDVVIVETVPVNVLDAIRRVPGLVLFHANINTYLSGLVSRFAENIPSIPSIAWREGEMKFSEHMLKQASEWERDPTPGSGIFVRKDRQGNVIATADSDAATCKMINANTTDCLAAITNCLSADGTNIAGACRALTEFNFQINPPINLLLEEVKKINPGVALGILRQFKFGEYLAEEPRSPVKGFRRYKVQSAGSWIQEIVTGQCVPPPGTDPCVPRPLKEQLGDLYDVIVRMAGDPSKHPFFTYLDVLAQWVNANPQVLNPEELKPGRGPHGTGFPPVDKTFRMYGYYNPYKPAELRLRMVSCDLDRLKGNILNELTGLNAPAMISTMANIPLGIEAPFARPGFINPVPFGFGNLVPMNGGGLFDTDLALQNLNYQYGYGVFDQIYKDLQGAMANISPTGDRRMKLAEHTHKDIIAKLENFRKTEEAVQKSLANLVERNRLYHASRGHVNAYLENPGEYATVLAKHSNLLSLSSAYNRRAVNLIDLFQTITKAVLNKMEEGKKVGSVLNTGDPNALSPIERPLTMGYRTGAKNF